MKYDGSAPELPAELQRRYSLLVEVYRLDATMGQFLALLVVTPLAFVAFKRWGSSSAERPASAGAGALKCRRDG